MTKITLPTSTLKKNSLTLTIQPHYKANKKWLAFIIPWLLLLHFIQITILTSLNSKTKLITENTKEKLV